MLGLLLNMSFANRIERGQFVPELKQGDFLRPVLNLLFFRNSSVWKKVL
jgi:hypothetical protein